MRSLQDRLAEGLLVIASVVVTCLVAEAAFSLVGIRHVPLRLHEDLPEDVRIFAQSSKAGVVPRDPVLLLGDSYAQGVGDWLYEADPNRNGPLNSAHVINDLTGRDVVTLGKSGAGSAEAMAVLPSAAYGDAERAWLLRLPPPRVAVVYFYEGNDLNNNMSFLSSRVDNSRAGDVVERIDRSIASYPSAFRIDRGWWRHFPLLRFSYSLAQRIYSEQTSTQQPESDDAANPETADQPNLVEVAGRPTALPAHLQSPAMELTQPELERAVLVFERSLAYLRKLLPGTPVLVVYLPSPLSSYRLSTPEVSIQQYLPDRDARYPKERVEELSDRICNLIRTAAIGQGAGFLDVRPAIRAASVHELLHGPDDFRHFNRDGMEVLGQAVAERIDRPLAHGPC